MASVDRPNFARDFPRAPPLDALVDAFVRGDYARVRAEGQRLAGSTEENDAVRQAARTLVSRTDPDPTAVWLLVLSAVLLAVLSAYWIGHGTAPTAVVPVASPPAPSK